ncbi:hypothetical protein BV898_17362 [Hypsibius exemplaris]|uniref:Uncharacterized protein n=1 Tax=Hypsibius exemplaris TaxID=2072580 RepID=A0A9X6NEY4_HYPEX|nr:hypothetical protein BV898_17362 [Hypsibius exemplaris]
MPTDKPSWYTILFRHRMQSPKDWLSWIPSNTKILKAPFSPTPRRSLAHQTSTFTFFMMELQPVQVAMDSFAHNVTSAHNVVRCTFAVENHQWGSSASDFHAFIQATFGDNTTNAIGIALITITMDRMREIDFIYPSAGVHYVIAVCEKHLVSAGDGAFFIALFEGVPVIATLAVIALI